MKRQSPYEKVLQLLLKKDARYKFKHLVAITHLSKGEVEAAIAAIRKTHKNLVFAKFDKTFYLADTPTWYSNQTDLSRVMPLEGCFGVISDTHLASVAERLDLVNLAYDTFQSHGVKQVFHIGDLTDGSHSYRGHMNFVKVYGSQAQAQYVIQKYPRKEGMTTYVISGNHDLDNYDKDKVDRLSLVTNGFDHEGKHYDGRKDIVYLGQYAHYIILPQEVRIHMVHPRGNNPYAISYRAQKRSEAFLANDRPDIELSGHFHQQFFLWVSGTYFVGCPGLQDITEYFVRLGFQRNLGFQILHYKIEAGKLAYLKPQVFMFC